MMFFAHQSRVGSFNDAPSSAVDTALTTQSCVPVELRQPGEPLTDRWKGAGCAHVQALCKACSSPTWYAEKTKSNRPVCRNAVEHLRRKISKLTELVAGVAAGAAVYLVEGEKDVDGLAALGLVATCNPEGA